MLEKNPPIFLNESPIFFGILNRGSNASFRPPPIVPTGSFKNLTVVLLLKDSFKSLIFLSTALIPVTAPSFFSSDGVCLLPFDSLNFLVSSSIALVFCTIAFFVWSSAILHLLFFCFFVFFFDMLNE